MSASTEVQLGCSRETSHIAENNFAEIEPIYLFLYVSWMGSLQIVTIPIYRDNNLNSFQ